VGPVTEVVEVTGGAQGCKLTNAEISTTMTNEVRRLPLINRSPLALIQTQAGVTLGRGNTVINGQRTSFANVTFEGVNAQDNFIRSNALDFLPNLLLAHDQVAEVTIVTSNAGAMFPGGTAQVSFVAPSGSNQFRGSLYWYNRNNKLAANTWFNNRDGIPRPFLNQNQAGGSLGGPIIKDKLLFYTNYEAFRLRQQSSANRTILTADARQGIFTYRDSARRAIRKANLSATGRRRPADPGHAGLLDQVPGPEKDQQFPRRRQQRGPAAQHRRLFLPAAQQPHPGQLHPEARLHPIHQTRPRRHLGLEPRYRGPAGPGQRLLHGAQGQERRRKICVSLTWRWNPTPSFTNEVRAGFNLAPGTFLTSEKFGAITSGRDDLQQPGEHLPGSGPGYQHLHPAVQRRLRPGATASSSASRLSRSAPPPSMTPASPPLTRSASGQATPV
jgi:hypothetical protein